MSLVLVAGEVGAQRAMLRPGTPRQGATPGTEQWVALLRGRSFSLRTRFAAIRAEPDQRRRRALVDAIAADSRREQQAFADQVQQLGGRVLQHHWMVNGCTIEISPDRVGALRDHPLAAILCPNEERKPSASSSMVGISAVAPIGGSSSSDNHNVGAAHTTLGHKGAAARVAFFDTGVDLDQSGAVGNGGTLPDPDPHRAFAGAGGTRIVWSEKINAIDCNDSALDPWCPSSSPINLSVRHGTGVAAIAVGRADPLTFFAEGHAPDAQLMSFSFCDPSPFPGATWPTTSGYVMTAIERLQAWLLENSGKPVHVLNISYDLWSDPQDPTQLALDMLEREFDVLVVVAASNEGDATRFAGGFTNGLSVGNVHKWRYDDTLASARYPNRASARGPLFGDGDRYYPDICASGASVGTSTLSTSSQIVMPLVDDQHQPAPPTSACRPALGAHQQWYDAAGTSMASPQVAGAAALYRAERQSATALETKAAVLLATVDPLQAGTTVLSLHTYIDRNATGAGYVRDDLLALYAKRAASDDIGTVVTLTAQNVPADIAWANLTPGARYAVAVAWPRVFPTDYDPALGVPVPWANVDLEVLTTGANPTVIARSDSRRNTYERLVFVPLDATVTVRVVARDEFPGISVVPVFIAGRRVTPITVTVNSTPTPTESKRSIPGFVKTIAQVPTCTHVVPEQSVSRTLPASYQEAYGSGAFALSTASSSSSTFSSLRIGLGQSIVENIYAASELGLGAGPFTIRGLALRSWSPFPGCDGTLTIESVYVYRRTHSVGQLLTGSGLLYKQNQPAGTLVASNLSIPVHDPLWNARGYDTWPIVIPFAAPYTVAASGDALGVWIKFGPEVCAFGGGYGVDFVSDSTPSLYAMFSTAGGTVGGDAAVIGLIEGDPAARNVRLDAYGFPRGNSRVLFHVRQAAPSSSVFVVLGATDPLWTISGCRVFSSADLYISVPIATSTMGDATLSFLVPPGSLLLHQHVFAQALTATGLYSNGLRLTIGGITP